MRVLELRSCYETDCVWWEGQNPPGRIRYFFVDENTPFLPFGTAFRSSQWDDEPEGAFDVGEVPGAARDYANGAPLYPVTGQGPPCGSADDFAGLAAPPPAPPLLNVYGGLACCRVPDRQFLHVACGCFPGGSWSVYTVRIRGATGDWAVLNGDWPVTFFGTWPGGSPSCYWESAAFEVHGITINRPLFVWLSDGNPANCRFLVQALIMGQSAFWVANLPVDWDALTPVLDVPVTHPGPIPGLPTTVSVFPGLAGPESPVRCPALRSTSPVYYLAYGATPLQGIGDFAIYPAAGTYAVYQSGPCSWEGSVLLVQGQFQTGGFQVRLTLTLDPGATPRVTVHASDASLTVFDGQWLGARGWTGDAGVVATPQNVFSGLGYYVRVWAINPPGPP